MAIIERQSDTLKDESTTWEREWMLARTSWNKLMTFWRGAEKDAPAGIWLERMNGSQGITRIARRSTHLKIPPEKAPKGFARPHKEPKPNARVSKHA